MYTSTEGSAPKLEGRRIEQNSNVLLRLMIRHDRIRLMACFYNFIFFKIDLLLGPTLNKRSIIERLFMKPFF